MSQVAVIGLDSAEWTYLEEMMQAGELPYLRDLRVRSAEIPLINTGPPGRVWESFLMGRHVPHDVFEFDRLAYRSYWLGARPSAPFYARDGVSRSVSAFEVPFMSLWPKVPGVQVVNWGGHNAGYPRASRPTGLVTEIDRRFGPPAGAGQGEGEWYDADALRSMGRAFTEGIEQRVQIARWLIQEHTGWDLYLFVFPEGHEASETLWHGVADDHPLHRFGLAGLAREQLDNAFRALDRGVEQIVGSLPSNTTVIVCSLHGSEVNDLDVPTMALLPELLYRWNFSRNFLEFPPTDARFVVPSPGTVWEDLLWGYRKDHAQGRSFKEAVAATLPWLVDAKRAVLRQAPRAVTPPVTAPHVTLVPPETQRSPEEIGRTRESTDKWVAGWYRDHWPRMRAFALPSIYEGRIRINVVGRETNGLVEPTDYDAVAQEIEDVLTSARDPKTGRSVVASIVRAEDPSEVGERDVDIVVYWNGTIDRIEHPSLGRIGPVPFRRTGGHSERGFALISGPEIRPGRREPRDTVDVPPTILTLLGERVPSDVEGTPIDLS